jgi:hypothetical protein
LQISIACAEGFDWTFGPVEYVNLGVAADNVPLGGLAAKARNVRPAAAETRKRAAAIRGIRNPFLEI